MIHEVLSAWHHNFGMDRPDVIVRAPGRINIIGEHTDYNEGWVMPGAISRSLYVLVKKSNSNSHHWHAFDINEEISLPPGEVPAVMPLWAKYLHGTIHLYAVDTVPLNVLIGGDLPIGAGISSSSALVCGLLSALQKIRGTSETKEALALLGSRVEREIIGLQGGIMDQYAIMLGKKDHVMMLDCRTETYAYYPASLTGYKWTLINTKVHHQLIDSDYNTRAVECRDAVEIIRKKYPNVKSLRDVNHEMLANVVLPQNLLQRCQYVIEENFRVHHMALALTDNNPLHAGRLLQQSHHGLQYQYEVSCAELDHLAGRINQYHSATFARMMGGGFGGCVLCLLPENIADEAITDAVVSYRNTFGIDPEIIDFTLDDGVGMVASF